METMYKSIITLDLAVFSSLLLFYYIKKDEINPILGYRTTRSMKNKKNWEFSQKYFSKYWLFSIPIMLITQLPIIFDATLDLIIPISLFNFVLYTIYLIVKLSVTIHTIKKYEILTITKTIWLTMINIKLLILE